MVSRNNTLTVHFDGDTRDFAKAIRQVNGDLAGFSRSTGGAQTSMASLHSSFTSFAIGATAVAATIGGTIAAVRSFATAASDLEESQSKVGVVFGESAGQIRQWSENASSALGMSQRQALEAAGTYGNFFQALGLTRDAALSMSPAVVQLASDLASFNNASPEETLIALRAGLSGEVEPLRKYGVAINAAAVEQEAMRLGLQKVNGEFAEAAKVQARYSLIMKQTETAQGDFARTSEGLANQNRSLTANFEELRAKLGKGVSPALADATQKLNEFMDSAEGEELIANLSAAIGGLASATLFLAENADKAFRIWKLLTPELQRAAGALQFLSKLSPEGLLWAAPDVNNRATGMTEAEAGSGPWPRRPDLQPSGAFVLAPRNDVTMDDFTKSLDEAMQAAARDAKKEETGAAKGAADALRDLETQVQLQRAMEEQIYAANQLLREAEHKAIQDGIDARKKEADAIAQATLGYLNSLGQRNVRFAPGVFEQIAKSGGLNPITSATVDGVDVFVP